MSAGIGSGIKPRRTKNGKKVWDVDTAYKQKKLRKRGFESLRAAKAWKQDQINSIDGFKYVEKTYRWEDLESLFRDRHFSLVRSSTSKRYQEDLKIRLIPEFQYMKLNDITTSYIESAKERWIESGRWKPKTINNCLTTLSTMFAKAVKWGLAGINPVENVDRLPVDNIQSEDWWNSKGYILSYIDGITNQPRHEGVICSLGYNAQEPYKAALVLPVELGLRRGEVCGLDKSDVDFHDCSITIRQSYRNGELTPPKTKNSARTLHFERNSLLYVLLKEAVQKNLENSALFVTSNANRLDGDELSEVFQHWREKLGLPYVTYHGLRRTFGCWYMRNGGNLWDLFQLMGHESYDVTVKRYARFGKNQVRAPSWVKKSEENSDDPHKTHTEVI